jgi:hypothetical protein
MRQKLDIRALYADATEQIRAMEPATAPGAELPAVAPFTLDQLLGESWKQLLDHLSATMSA